MPYAPTIIRFESFAKWTRTQRIRTVAQLPFDVAIVSTLQAPVYQRIAPKALHLRELGLTDTAIAGRLKVSDKTVAKGIRWLQSQKQTVANPSA